MEDSQDFVDFIKAICSRPKMFVKTGTYDEVSAFVGGYIWQRSTPISSRLFERFICIKHAFPTNYIWSYVIDVISFNDEEAIKNLQDNILHFIELRAIMNDDELEQYAYKLLNDLLKQEGEPERIFRLFEKALLDGNREIIEPIIKSNSAAEILWSGSYPSDVASILQEINLDEPIRRIFESDNGKIIKILASGWPFPIEMNNINGNWIINADQIIQMRIDGKSK